MFLRTMTLNRAWLGVFLAGLSWMAFLSFIPFTWVSGQAEFLSQIRQGLHRFYDSQTIAHAVYWTVLSMCGTLAVNPRRTRTLWYVCLPVLGGSSLAIEILQALVRGRHATIGDLLVAWAASVLSIAGIACWIQMNRRTKIANAVGRGLARLLLLGFIAGIIWTLIQKQRPFDCWAENYPLMLGNEAEEMRPWRGDIQGVGVYAKALSRETIQELEKIPIDTQPGLALRQTLGAIVLYPLDENNGTTVHDYAHVNDPIDLTIMTPGNPQWISPSGLRFTAPGTVQSSELASRSRLVQGVRQNHQVTVEAYCTTADRWQKGPARIVSLSKNPYLRNLTLGQVDDAAVVRLRTPGTGPNGQSNLAVSWYGVFMEAVPNHLVLTYQNRQLRLFVNGLDQGPRTYYLRDGLHLALERGPGNCVMTCMFISSLALLGWASKKKATTQS